MCTVLGCYVRNPILLKPMNVYDFDGTIYNGDSTVDFFLYALKHNPFLLRFFPKQLWGVVLYVLKRIDKTCLKEYFFSFLTAIKTEELVEKFWNQNQSKIYSWYLDQKKPDDVVISASPEFLLLPICKRLNIVCLIASRVNTETGKFIGKNCYGAEKVRRLKTEYNAPRIEEFYSDTHSDLPLAKIADRAYFVVQGKIFDWNFIL